MMLAKLGIEVLDLCGWPPGLSRGEGAGFKAMGRREVPIPGRARFAAFDEMPEHAEKPDDGGNAAGGKTVEHSARPE